MRTHLSRRAFLAAVPLVAAGPVRRPPRPPRRAARPGGPSVRPGVWPQPGRYSLGHTGITR